MFIFTQDASSDMLTWSIIVGVVGGIFPIPLVASLMTTLMGLVFNVNFPIVMAVNYLATPLEYLLFMPFVQAGDLIKKGVYHLMKKEFEAVEQTKFFDFGDGYLSGLWNGIQTSTGVLTWACLAWMVLTPIPAVILYHALKPAFVKLTDHFKSVNGNQVLETSVSPALSSVLETEETTP